LSMVSTLGFTSALLKTHERDAHTPTERKELIGTTLLVVLPLTTILTAGLYFFRSQLAEWLLDDASLSHLIAIVLGTNWLLVLYQVGLAVLRTKERSRFYATLTVIRALFLLGFNLVALLVFHLGLEAVLGVQLLVNAILDILLLRTLLRESSFRFSIPLFKRLTAFGLAVFPAQIAMWFMDLSDRFFLKEALSFDEVGYYSLAYRIGTVVNILLIVPFQLAWPTYSYSIADSKVAQKKYAHSLSLFVSGGLFLALALSLYASGLIRLLGTEAYQSAVVIVPFVATGYVLYGAHFILTTGIHLKNKSRWYPLFIVIPALLNIALNAVFVPRHGILAAATTTLVSFVLVSVLTYIVTQRVYPVSYLWKQLVTSIAVFCVVLMLGWWVVHLEAIPRTASVETFAWEFLTPLPFLLIYGLALLKTLNIPLRTLPERVKTLLSRM
ncbi:MAG: oligosaccharide flippase family protein, partial [Candidatus Andersenbacteria bacterium]|nr:oligosaccharide flippase family protein [Candidatus Andersenbacteria bacterium]